MSRRVPGASIFARPPPRREILNIRTPRGRRIAGRAPSYALSGNLLDSPSPHLVCRNRCSRGRSGRRHRGGITYRRANDAERTTSRTFTWSTHRTKISRRGRGLRGSWLPILSSAVYHGARGPLRLRVVRNKPSANILHGPSVIKHHPSPLYIRDDVVRRD
jgi:hypothetical protein